MKFLRALGELLGFVRAAQDGDTRDAEARGRASRIAGEIAAQAEAAADAAILRARGPRCATCHGIGYLNRAVCGACGGTGDAVEAPR